MTLRTTRRVAIYTQCKVPETMCIAQITTQSLDIYHTDIASLVYHLHQSGSTWQQQPRSSSQLLRVINPLFYLNTQYYGTKHL